MGLWLFANDYTEKLQLPVNPPELNIKTGNKNTVVDIQGLGEANLIGKPTLAEIEIASFFPVVWGPYCAYRDIPAPWQTVLLIRKWKVEGKPIRFYVTDTPINVINVAVAIEEFTYGMKGGTNDVYYTLLLKEYRQLSVPTIGTIERPNLMVAP